MLIQVSEGRWLSEPDALAHKSCSYINDVIPVGQWRDGHDWVAVARMPSGAIEWLDDKEYWLLISAFGVLEDE